MATTTQQVNTTSATLRISQLEVGQKFRFSESGIQHEVRSKSKFFVDYARLGEILEHQWWFVSEDREVIISLEN